MDIREAQRREWQGFFRYFRRKLPLRGRIRHAGLLERAALVRGWPDRCLL